MSATVAEKCFLNTFVDPQWLPDGQSFWYRRQDDEGKFKFIYVDIKGGSTRPAFDHQQLANALQKGFEGQMEVQSDALPFSWIELEDSVVRFRFRGQIWQYEPGKGLSQWPGKFTQGNAMLMQRQQSSVLNANRVFLAVTNSTRSTLFSSFVDDTGKVYPHGAIDPGQTDLRWTHAGICWRFEDASSGQLRGIYCVPNRTHNSVVVSEVDVDEYLGKEEQISDGSVQGKDDKDSNTEANIQLQEGSKPQPENSTDVKLGQEKHGTEPYKDDVDPLRKKDATSSPDVFVRDGNLWLKDEKDIECQLAQAENPDEDGYDDELIYISPNHHFVVAWHCTSGSITDEYWVKCYPETQTHPKLIEKQKRLPGDKMRIYRPRVFSLALKHEIETIGELFSSHYQLIHLGWTKDSSEYRFLYDGRGHQTIRIISINCDGLVQVLYEEKSNTFIDVTTKLQYIHLAQSDRLIWASEQDGYNHLYLLDLKERKIQNQITKGEWNIKMIERIDEDTEQIWISTYGFYSNQDPYYMHLVRAKFDGTECQALTNEDGTHIWSWPPSGSPQYFVDSWSRVDLPPQTVVRSADTGTIQLKVEGVSADELRQQGWTPLERFHCAGRDGETLIYGVIAKPANLNSSQNYPILEYIYAGPYDFHVPKSFSDGLNESLNMWSDEGFVAVKVDGMGTNWRSKKFHEVCYKNANDAGFPDRMIWIKKAAETRPWMDLDRVGIIGGSAGGHNAASALLHFGHFYKVAVADSGQYDNSLANLAWAEQWLGYPVDDSYTEQSVTAHAAKLPDSAKLMVVVGLLDHSVNPVSTYRFIQQLNKANKTYELVLIPDGPHGCAFHGYGLKRAQAFLKANLGSKGLEDSLSPTTMMIDI